MAAAWPSSSPTFSGEVASNEASERQAVQNVPTSAADDSISATVGGVDAAILADQPSSRMRLMLSCCGINAVGRKVSTGRRSFRLTLLSFAPNTASQPAGLQMSN